MEVVARTEASRGWTTHIKITGAAACRAAARLHVHAAYTGAPAPPGGAGTARDRAPPPPGTTTSEFSLHPPPGPTRAKGPPFSVVFG